MTEFIMSKPLREFTPKVWDDFVITVKAEGPYLYFDSLEKGDWRIWGNLVVDPGFNAAKLVDGKFKHHHHTGNQKELKHVIGAMQWVNNQIEKGV